MWYCVCWWWPLVTLFEQSPPITTFYIILRLQLLLLLLLWRRHCSHVYSPFPVCAPDCYFITFYCLTFFSVPDSSPYVAVGDAIRCRWCITRCSRCCCYTFTYTNFDCLCPLPLPHLRLRCYLLVDVTCQMGRNLLNVGGTVGGGTWRPCHCWFRFPPFVDVTLLPFYVYDSHFVVLIADCILQFTVTLILPPSPLLWWHYLYLLPVLLLALLVLLLYSQCWWLPPPFVALLFTILFGYLLPRRSLPLCIATYPVVRCPVTTLLVVGPRGNYHVVCSSHVVVVTTFPHHTHILYTLPHCCYCWRWLVVYLFCCCCWWWCSVCCWCEPDLCCITYVVLVIPRLFPLLFPITCRCYSHPLPTYCLDSHYSPFPDVLRYCSILFPLPVTITILTHCCWLPFAYYIVVIYYLFGRCLFRCYRLRCVDDSVLMTLLVLENLVTFGEILFCCYYYLCIALPMLLLLLIIVLCVLCVVLTLYSQCVISKRWYSLLLCYSVIPRYYLLLFIQWHCWQLWHWHCCCILLFKPDRHSHSILWATGKYCWRWRWWWHCCVLMMMVLCGGGGVW